MNWTATIPLALAALAIEALCGYPDRVYRAIGHPVTWIGRLIAWLDDRTNRDDARDGRRRIAGIRCEAIVLLASGGAAAVLAALLAGHALGWLVLAVLASSLVAQRSLHRHVAAVAEALERGRLEDARAAVGQIVGRDTAILDRAGIARAAIESLAENFSDGIVAPVFWISLAGLPGGVVYKAANTADSMIGHRTRRHEAFGWAAARLDDLLNLPASRLSAFWIFMASVTMPDPSPMTTLAVVWRDARGHRSPNAGWPEAAMAGALGLSLGGPRVYGGLTVEDAYMGRGNRSPSPDDIRRALDLYRRACVVQAFCLAVLTLCLISRP